MKRIALLSNVNIDLLKSHLNKNDSYSLYVTGYNQWQSELINYASGLYSFQPDVVFIYLNAEMLKSYRTDLFSCIETFDQQNPNTQFIITNLSLPPFSVNTYLSKKETFDLQINEDLKSFALEKNNVFILDFNRLITYYGYESLFDDKYWYLGRIKFSNQGFKVLAQELKNVLDSISGNVKKLLVVDLDNTLWGGVVGEDHWQYLQLSEDGIGSIYTDFQKNIKELAQSGILLATCSKNNEQDAREVFEKNVHMQLRWTDFVIHKINWNQKSQNILEIASALNIGLNAIVFIDDNPVERELVRQNIPELIVPEFPTDISKLNRWFILEVVYPFFSKISLTAEDLDKSNQYKRNFKRELAKMKLNFDDFISQLEIKLIINELKNGEPYHRVAQLSQKTNQFNLSVRRYTDLDVKKLVEKSDYLVYTCAYEDKFGNEGIIGCAVLEIGEKKVIIDSFLLSCRVLGRNVEYMFLNQIIKKIKTMDIQFVEAIYNETSQNKIVRSFLIESGFETKDNIKYIKYIE
ncbi:MAG: HAD-IIIC family phosphatase [Paludibacter sp.]|nr:HAD-IIIC family phosphatase [Paludibacter sp.]